MSKLTDEIVYFKELFDNLQSTNSRLEKLDYVRQMPDEYKRSWKFILECLDGKHPFGYKYPENVRYIDMDEVNIIDQPVHIVLKYLLQPMEQHDLSISNIAFYVKPTSKWSWFFEPIVNRTLKLGIGRSLLETTETSPMLAQKFDDKTFGKLNKFDTYYLTEKLDGNRCIAYHDGIEWNFVSRNGKPMYVKFDMCSLPETLIFDGEVMSKEQTHQSELRAIGRADLQGTSSTAAFSQASGLINTHDYNKDFVYNIFDIVDDNAPYNQRRAILSQLKPTDDVRILPILTTASYGDLMTLSSSWLDYIASRGGEGIMINAGHAAYQHKRNVNLLKFKKTYTMDMKVIDILDGTSKYEGQVGALKCMAEQEDKVVICNVGTGLSDDQRFMWALRPDKILGKTVEIGYFSLSQDRASDGTNYYSLRFPRLVKVREDKNETNMEV